MTKAARAVIRPRRQTGDFQALAHEAVLAVLRTATVLRRDAARVVAPHDLTTQQFNVLRILRGAGDGGLPTLEVADRMIEDTPGITRLLDRLEAKGLIARQRCREDRRQHLCAITPAGLRLLAELDAPMLAAEAHSLRGLDATEVRKLLSLLARVREGG